MLGERGLEASVLTVKRAVAEQRAAQVGTVSYERNQAPQVW